MEARRRLKSIRQNGLAVQLGGAAGTLAALVEAGPEVLRLFAEELELQEPVAPWHTNRVRIAELGAALDVSAGVLAKIGLDVGLLSQTEVAEVREAEGGVSSTMPQKRNPIGSALAVACARQVHAQASVLAEALPQEHERALGAWHSEWPALRNALAYTGGAAAAARRALEGLEVDTDRMRENLEPTVMAEKASVPCSASEAKSGARSPTVATEEADLEAGDPMLLGSAETFVDRALAAYREELQ